VATTELLAALENAWNAGDGAAWAENFSEDTFFVDAFGGVHRGSATLREEHQELFDTVFRGATLSYRSVETRPLADGLDLLHLSYVVRVPDGPRAGQFTGMQVMLVRDGKILDFQNTVERHDPAMAGVAGHPR
jgi:uncharacterized protein (TIGR02246 family)